MIGEESSPIQRVCSKRSPDLLRMVGHSGRPNRKLARPVSKNVRQCESHLKILLFVSLGPISVRVLENQREPA